MNGHAVDMGGGDAGRGRHRDVEPSCLEPRDVLVDHMRLAGARFASQEDIGAGFEDIKRLALGHAAKNTTPKFLLTK